jgi:hypothetical protein
VEKVKKKDETGNSFPLNSFSFCDEGKLGRGKERERERREKKAKVFAFLLLFCSYVFCASGGKEKRE